MRFPTKWTLTLTVLAAALGAVASNARAGDGEKKDGRPRGAGLERGRFRHGGFGRRAFLRERMRHFRQERKAVLEALGVTPDQQRIALDKARAAQPVVAEARKELAQLRAGTDGTRESRRDAVRDLRHRTAEKLAPLAKDVIATLTPEQRAKLEGFAAAHGRKFDDAKFAKRVSRWLARPMTVDTLEAKLGTK
jgi:hypothetical protein